MTETMERGLRDVVCLSCPASLACLQYIILRSYHCNKCGKALVHFVTSDGKNDVLRVRVPNCPKKTESIASCYECASSGIHMVANNDNQP